MKKLKYYFEQIFNIPLRLDYNPKIKMCRQSQYPIRRNHPCGKEPETCKWIEDYVKKGDIFYDIGACAGGYSFVAELNGAFVYAFDPKEDLIVKNIKMNNSKIIFFPVAPDNNLHKLDDFKIQKPDHIKLDVDGVEIEVVKGAIECIKHVKSMMIEISENREEVMKIIGEHMTLKGTYKREAPNTFNYLYEKLVAKN